MTIPKRWEKDGKERYNNYKLVSQYSIILTIILD